MNYLLIGNADKTARLLEVAKRPFLLVGDREICNEFARKFPRSTPFDPHRHSFNPLAGIDVPRARTFAELLYDDKDLMTYRNGKRALTRMFLTSKRLDDLPQIRHSGKDEAHETVQDLLLSPTIKRVLCGKPNFNFSEKTIIANLDRAMLGDFDALVIGTLLIGQYRGQIIVPDFGFFARAFYASLIRQRRLICGLNSLSELSLSLQQMMLGIPDKEAHQCLFEDAETLAKYRGLIPNTVAHTDYIQRAVGAA